MIKKTMMLGAFAAMCTVNAWADTSKVVNLNAIKVALKNETLLDRGAFVSSLQGNPLEVTLDRVAKLYLNCYFGNDVKNPMDALSAFLNNVAKEQNVLNGNLKAIMMGDGTPSYQGSLIAHDENYNICAYNLYGYSPSIILFQDCNSINPPICVTRSINPCKQDATANWGYRVDGGKVISGDVPEYAFVGMDALLYDTQVKLRTETPEITPKDVKDAQKQIK